MLPNALTLAIFDKQALELLRAKRLEQMKKAQESRQKFLQQGHGAYTELYPSQNTRDVAKDFFEATKKSQRLVVHFYRSSSSALCDIFHKHLTILAEKHVETKFVKLNVEGCDSEQGGGASFLVEKLGIVVMPTLVLIRNRQAIHHIRGFDELGMTENFSTEALEYVLGSHGILDTDENQEPPRELIEGPKGVNCIHLRTRKQRTYNDDY